MSQEVNRKQKVSENNRPYATQPQPPRSGLVQLVIYRSAFRDINIRKGRLQDEGSIVDKVFVLAMVYRGTGRSTMLNWNV
jgi:hypothetical protein